MRKRTFWRPVLRRIKSRVSRARSRTSPASEKRRLRNAPGAGNSRGRNCGTIWSAQVAVELHSLSKTYNMAGFRVGMLVGNADLVDAVGRLKSNIDSGMFRPIQYAAIEALQLPVSWIEQRNAIYRRRRNMLVEGCNAIGMHTRTPQAGLYIWAAIPQGYTSRDFANWLFDKTGVFITPGTNFGNAGEGYVRISLTAPDERIETALKRMKEALEG